jgi:NADH dehydrogenase FAD-containing subunit
VRLPGKPEAPAIAGSYHGNEQLAENSIGLKTLADGTRLRNHVLGCLERADHEDDPDQRRALLTFVVAGRGPGEWSTPGRSASC